MLAQEAAPVRERHQQQPENRRDHDEDDSFFLRRLAAIRLEIAVLTRVPTLDWPSDLFANAGLGVTI
jgi:hypothetical protein